jgi:hypothetical protein
MLDNENLVLDDTENVETVTTEETTGEEQVEIPVKTYTQEEVDEIVGKRLARNTAKIRKEYTKKYGDLENVLKAGTGKDNVVELTDTFREFYTQKGIHIPSEPTYSGRDIEVLAKAEADDIINAGFEEVVEEVDRLAELGIENMSAREKQVFKTLAEYRQNAERSNELSKLGVTEDVYNSKEFKDFASKFGTNTTIKEIYEIYNKMQPKKEVRTMGSLKNNTTNDTGVKDFYTRDEALKFTKKDFDNNPELFKAVEKSMLKW